MGLVSALSFLIFRGVPSIVTGAVIELLHSITIYREMYDGDCRTWVMQALSEEQGLGSLLQLKNIPRVFHMWFEIAPDKRRFKVFIMDMIKIAEGCGDLTGFLSMLS
jgi:hypothetical protein